MDNANFCTITMHVQSVGHATNRDKPRAYRGRTVDTEWTQLPHLNGNLLYCDAIGIACHVVKDGSMAYHLEAMRKIKISLYFKKLAKQLRTLFLDFWVTGG